MFVTRASCGFRGHARCLIDLDRSGTAASQSNSEVEVRRSAHLLAVVGLALGWAGSATAAEVVNVYNARHYGSDQQLWDGFKKATGIEVNVVSGDHDPLLQRLVAEGARSPADLFITVDAGRLAVAIEKGVLQPIGSELVKTTIPAHLRDRDDLWTGLSVRARVLIYAKDRVGPGELSTYEALAEPGFKGRILVRSSTNIYNLGLLGSLIEANGFDRTLAWCKGLVANLARPPQGGDTDQILAAAAGVGDVAISNTYYFGRLAASTKPEDRAAVDKLAVFFPNQGDRGTHVNVSGVGLVKHAPNRANAVRLIEYLVSPEAQRYLADVNHEFPANPAVPAGPVAASWGGFKQDALNATVYAQRSAEALRLADQCGWK
jgi:iron(III) transport system substrate-binding protein